jgi:hypothetical protein
MAKPITNIISNGSKWNGEKPDSIATLCHVLKTHPLEERLVFKQKHITSKPGVFEWVISWPIKKQKRAGVYNFFGNFKDICHVFNIETNDQKVIKTLKMHIMNNSAYPALRAIVSKKALIKR